MAKFFSLVQGCARLPGIHPERMPFPSTCGAAATARRSGDPRARWEGPAHVDPWGRGAGGRRSSQSARPTAGRPSRALAPPLRTAARSPGRGAPAARHRRRNPAAELLPPPRRPLLLARQLRACLWRRGNFLTRRACGGDGPLPGRPRGGGSVSVPRLLRERSSLTRACRSDVAAGSSRVRRVGRKRGRRENGAGVALEAVPSLWRAAAASRVGTDSGPGCPHFRRPGARGSWLAPRSWKLRSKVRTCALSSSRFERRGSCLALRDAAGAPWTRERLLGGLE